MNRKYSYFVIITLIIFTVVLASLIIYKLISPSLHTTNWKSTSNSNITKIEFLSDAELLRFKAYGKKADYNCTESCRSMEIPDYDEQKRCYIDKCLGGQKAYEDYLQLFDKYAASAKNLPNYQRVTEGPSSEKSYDRRGYLKNAYMKNGNRYIDIDYIQYLGDTQAIEDGPEAIYTLEATKACRDDGDCLDEDGCMYDLRFSCVNNGYYIRNNDPTVHTLNVSPSAKIMVLGWDQKEDSITMVEYTDNFNTLLAKMTESSTGLVDIIVTENQITGIDQVYTP